MIYLFVLELLVFQILENVKARKVPRCAKALKILKILLIEEQG